MGGSWGGSVREKVAQRRWVEVRGVHRVGLRPFLSPMPRRTPALKDAVQLDVALGLQLVPRLVIGDPKQEHEEEAKRVGGSMEERLRTLAVGPLAEELVFRGCMLPVLLSAGLTPLQACLQCPLIFGLAHLHHAYERVKNGVCI